jgi:hypothetical protein
MSILELRFVFRTSDQLSEEIKSHYTRQFLRQFYVLVLGLDILG